MVIAVGGVMKLFIICIVRSQTVFFLSFVVCQRSQALCVRVQEYRDRVVYRDVMFARFLLFCIFAYTYMLLHISYGTC